MNNLIQRALTGALFVIVMLACIIYAPLSLQILFLVVSAIALYEFYVLVSTNEIKPQKFGGVVAGIVVFLSVSGLVNFIPMLLAYAVVAVLFFIELYRKNAFPFHSLAYTVIGILYITVPFALIIRTGFDGETYSYVVPLGFFILLWCSDTFAYLFGMKFGKHRLFERISPKKSWEGSAGGFTAAMLAAYILSKTMGYLTLQEWLIVAAIIVVTGTLGDLVESMVKRSFQKKDSGTILPGHGGLLDRFDGMLLSIPFVYLYLSMK